MFTFRASLLTSFRASSTTAADGSYLIDGLLPGDYRAGFELPDGYGFTTQTAGTDGTVDSNPDPSTGLTETFTISASVSGDTVADTDAGTDALFVNPTIDAGVVELVGVGDFVWVDADLDGVFDAGELPLEGVTVTLYEADGVTPVMRADGTPATAVTGPDGSYIIDGLLRGTYRAAFTLPTGYQFTEQGAGSDETSDSNPDPLTGLTATFTFDGVSFVGDIDAGVVPLVAVSNSVWIDADGDGIFDAGEEPLEGVTITLYEADGVTVAKRADGTDATAVTAADGSYLIDGLLPGEYRAQFNLPDGYEFTAASMGSNGMIDSDADPATGMTGVFTIAAGVSGDTIVDSDDATTAVFVNPTIGAGVVADDPPAPTTTAAAGGGGAGGGAGGGGVGGRIPGTGQDVTSTLMTAGFIVMLGALFVLVFERRRRAARSASQG